jgi:hypothetical protein
MKNLKVLLFIALISGLFAACGSSGNNSEKEKAIKPEEPILEIDIKLEKYSNFRLKSDISHLSENQKEMLKYLFETAEIMDDLYWKQNVGNKDTFIESIKNEKVKRFAVINYGAWDGLDNLKPFVEGWTAKPAGAQFYPEGMTKEEFEAFDNEDKNSQYTILKRAENGDLLVQWYHEAYKESIEKAAVLLEKASKLADNKAFGKYLALSAEALRTDDYFERDMAWLDVTDNDIDFVVGPIENYTDQLFGVKAAFEAFVLIKDKEWSDKLQKYAKFLPQMQKELPVDDKYKQDVPGAKTDLNAYDAVYYAGD